MDAQRPSQSDTPRSVASMGHESCLPHDQFAVLALLRPVLLSQFVKIKHDYAPAD
jgi:hypothetical protein